MIGVNVTNDFCMVAAALDEFFKRHSTEEKPYVEAGLWRRVMAAAILGETPDDLKAEMAEIRQILADLLVKQTTEAHFAKEEARKERRAELAEQRGRSDAGEKARMEMGALLFPRAQKRFNIAAEPFCIEKVAAYLRHILDNLSLKQSI